MTGDAPIDEIEAEVAANTGRSARPLDIFKVNNFDLIRLFAALQVAIFHGFARFNLPVPSFLAPLGWFQGVPIFFMISGFLISASFERRRDWRRYARNRALRIFPGLWACVIATTVVAAMFGFPVLNRATAIWLTLQLAGAIYTPSFLRTFGDGSYNGSLWTIPLELQFYVVLPIVYAATAIVRDKTRALVTCFALFLLIGCLVKLRFPDIATTNETAGVKLLRYTFIPRFYLFMFGVALQRLQVYRSNIVRGKAPYWLAAYAMLNFVVPQVGLIYVADELVLGLTVMAIAYTVPQTADRVLRGNDISYGVYLYHGLLINVAVQLGLPTGPWSIPAMLAAAIGVATASWLMIERPAMRLRRARPNPIGVTG